MSQSNQPYTIVILIGLLLLAFTFSLTKIYDYDIWWHLKSGEQIITSLNIPRVDSFSITTEGQEWINVHWLSQILFFSVFSLTGFTGVQFFVFAIVAIVILLLFRIGRHEKLYALSYLFLIYIAIYASKDRFLPRPDIFTLLFPALYLFILYRFQFQNKKAIYLLPFFQILWVNMHGSYILGPLLIFACAMGMFLEFLLPERYYDNRVSGKKLKRDDEKRRDNAKKLKLYHLLAVLALSLALILINPYGFKIFGLFGTYLGSFYSTVIGHSENLPPVTIQEWLPTFSSSAIKYHHTFLPFYIALVILGFFSFMLNIKKFSFPLFFVFSGFFALSCFALRNVSVFSLLSAPIIAHNLNGFFSSTRWRKYEKTGSKRFLPATVFLLFLILIFLSIFDVASHRYFIRHALPLEMNFGVSRFPFPFGAAEFMRQEKITGPFYNNFESGGFLIWSLYPEYKVFTDGRYIDPEFNRINLAATQEGSQWKDMMDRYNVEAALLKFPSQDTAHLITILASSEHWKIVYLDWNSIIFLKDSPKNRSIIDQHGLLMPDIEERPAQQANILPFGDHLMQSFLRKEMNRHPFDRFFQGLASWIEKYQKEPLPMENLNKAYLFHIIGFYRASIEEYEKVLERLPQYEPAHYELGLLYFKIEDYENSLREMKQLIEKDRKAFETFYYAGLSSFYLHRNKEAALYLEKALEWKPGDYSTHFFLGLSHLHGGDLFEAERSMKKAIAINPIAAEAYFNLGTIYHLKKDPLQAKQAFQKALSINPSFEEAREELEQFDP